MNKVKNVIKDTRKDVKYVIWAPRKLSRREKLDQIKMFNFNPVNIRQKSGTTVELQYREE